VVSSLAHVLPVFWEIPPLDVVLGREATLSAQTKNTF
jgi:hypothetical protein